MNDVVLKLMNDVVLTLITDKKSPVSDIVSLV